MLDKYLNKLLGLRWFRRALIIAVLCFTFRLTTWGANYAVMALSLDKDLVGAAAIIGAVAAIPLGLLTMLFNKYEEKRVKDDDQD
jgi:hypothetical protein